MKHEHIKQFEIATESDAKRVLRRAREMVKAGWCQKWAEQIDPWRRIHSRCASRAIEDAANELRLDDFVPLALLTKVIGTPYNIPMWNDAENRSKADVLAAFDKAMRIA
jgi:hypothetical protein